MINMVAINFVKSFITGTIEIGILAVQGIIYLLPKLLIYGLIIFSFIYIISATGLYDKFIDFLNIDWFNTDEYREQLNMRGYGG